jgi:hypothetical protein
MWADNETTIDLLGFDLVELVLTDPSELRRGTLQQRVGGAS